MSLTNFTIRLAALAACRARAAGRHPAEHGARNHGKTDMPLRCEIVTRSTGMGVQLEGHVHAEEAPGAVTR